MNLINLLLCAIKTSLSYYRLGIMRGLLSLLLLLPKCNAPLTSPDIFSHNLWGNAR